LKSKPGTHGFLHTAFGEHTESLGIMKNFPLPATKRLTGYTCIQTGITTHIAHIEIRLNASTNAYGPSLYVDNKMGKQFLHYSPGDQSLRSDIASIVGEA
jgi:hypothetical protein